MTSPVKLPPLPSAVDTVRALFRGQPDYFQAQDSYYTQDQMRAYAEQAVREALAAQEPVAWVMQVGMRQEFLPNSKVLLATGMGYQPKPLALIPEKDHGEPS